MHTAMRVHTVAREWTVHDGSAFAFNVLRGIARAPNEKRYISFQGPDSDTFGPTIPTKVAATCDKLPKPGMANAETQTPQMDDGLLAEYEGRVIREAIRHESGGTPPRIRNRTGKLHTPRPSSSALHPSPLVSKTANTWVIPKRSASPP